MLPEAGDLAKGISGEDREILQKRTAGDSPFAAKRSAVKPSHRDNLKGCHAAP
jgi:hypothetical protein